jgi:hypothetical protein
MNGKDSPQPASLSAEEIAQVRAELGDGPAVLLAFHNRLTGEADEVLVISERTAEDLAGSLGYFGLPETVVFFAAAATAELTEGDFAALVGGDPADVRAEIERMEQGGMLVRREVDGVACYSAGNPTLKRFFLKRFAPERKKLF